MRGDPWCTLPQVWWTFGRSWCCGRGGGAPELPRRFYGKCKSEGTGFWEVKAKHGILVSKGKAWDPGKYVGKYAKARHGILVSKHRAKHGMLERQEKQSIGFR